MQHTSMLTMLGGALVAALLSAPAQAQTQAPTATDATSIRGCRPPSDAKEAQVLTFDPSSLQAKLAVSLGKDDFKVITIRLWDRPDDPRPVIPVIEAARIMEGQLQFYTPDLNADLESVSNRFVLIAEMGGPQICWATPSALLGEGGYPATNEASPEPTPAAATSLETEGDRHQ